MNIPRRTCWLIAGSFLTVSSLAQTPPERTIDVTDKALITKETPTSKATATPAVKQYTIEQFMDTERIGGGAFSHDEDSILFHSNKSGIFNVYSVPVTGGAPKQLTHSKKESTYAVSYFPADDRFLYTYDKGGNENNHIYLSELDGTERDLTPGEKVKADFLGWAHDEKSFFVSTNERDPKFFDVYEMTLPDLKRSLVFQNDAGFEFAAISPDKRYIAFTKPGVSTADSDVHLYDRETKEMKHITPHEGESINAAETFDPTSKYFLFLSNDGAEFTYIARYDLETGKRTKVEEAPWDIQATYFSKNGKYRVVSINEDGRTKVKIVEEATGKFVPLPELPAGDITGIRVSDGETKMRFFHTGSRSPQNLYVYDFAKRQPTKLTNTLNPEIDPEDLVEAKVVRFKSFDGMEIPAILYQPHGASAARKVPGIINVHGGPGGQARLPYNAVRQFLANHGYAILDVNNRGSSGYGKTFFTADDRKHGREPLWDCIEAKKYLASLDFVDGEKIGIMGGSYGGYMVLAAMAFRPDAFDVGVNIFGVANWVRTLQSMPTYWEAQKKALFREMGDPGTDLEMLREISPLFHADKITKPIIVLQGANDPRVLKVESDEMVEAIKKRDGVVEYVVFDDEGHGFTKKQNEIRAYSAILKFLDEHLKQTTPPKTSAADR